jgi:hypothetical protein
MCLRLKFCIHQRVWVLHFLKKVKLLFHVVDYYLGITGVSICLR